MKTALMTIVSLSAFVLGASAAGWKPVPGHMMTRWAKDVDPAKPHPEHTRPQMTREAWLNLNGLWQFEITAKEAPQPGNFSQQILVPFPVESALSGVKKRIEPKDRLWYQRGFQVPESWRAVRYFQGVGGEGLRLDWLVPGARFEEIPASAFAHKE